MNLKISRARYRNVLLQYMTRYGAVVLVTACLMLALMNWILRQYKEELIENSRAELIESLWELDEHLMRQEEVAREIYLNSLSKPSHMLAGSLYAKEGVSQIKLFSETLEVNDYVLVRYQDEELFTQYGNITRENAIDVMLKLDHKSENIFTEALNNHENSTVGVLTDQNGKNMLMSVYPVLNHLSDGKDMIGFIIYGESIQKYLQSVLEQENLYAVMLGKEGQELFEYNELKGMTNEELDRLHEQLLDGEEKLLKDYTYGSYDSQNGFVFYYALQNDALFADYHRIIMRTLVMGMLIFVCAVGMISLVNRANVRRIKNLRDELLHYNDGELILQEQDEFRQIQHLIRKMYQEQRRISAVQEQIVRILCGGLIEQEEVLTGIVQRVCPRMKSPYYTILSVVTWEYNDKLITALTKEEPFRFFIEERYQDTTVLSFVIGLEEEDLYGHRRRRLAEALLQKAGKHGVMHMIVMASRICGQLCEISGAYQAMLSMTYFQIAGMQMYTERIFLFETVIRENRVRYFSQEDIERLKELLDMGSVDEVMPIFNKLLKEIEKSGNAVIQGFGRCILAEISSEILEAQGVSKDQVSKIRRLSVEDGAAFAKGLISVVRKNCVETTVPIETIMSYIDSHYKDESLGLDALASRFHMSVSSISRYIKDQNGQKYTEYISNLRIEEACRLLTETDVKVQYIPFEIGYKDYVSFSKKFKSAKGISPSEYRARQREKEADMHECDGSEVVSDIWNEEEKQ